MDEQQAEGAQIEQGALQQATEQQLEEDVQKLFANWLEHGPEDKYRASGLQEVLPLPIMLLHLYRDLLRFYERRLGMSQSRIMLLHELMHTGEISQTELAQRLGMEAALMTRFAKQMEVSGLISRRVDPEDNRFTLVLLTQAGQQVFQQMMLFSREFEAQLVEGLSSDEQTAIRQALTHIQEKFLEIKEL
ncbi:MAG TPA: MarR family transcriptional regulator [Ktedonobacteraceae bacterium]